MSEDARSAAEMRGGEKLSGFDLQPETEEERDELMESFVEKYVEELVQGFNYPLCSILKARGKIDNYGIRLVINKLYTIISAEDYVDIKYELRPTLSEYLKDARKSWISKKEDQNCAVVIRDLSQLAANDPEG